MRSLPFRLLALHLGVLVVSACAGGPGGDDDDKDSLTIADEPVSGTVDGAAWTVVAGDALWEDGDPEMTVTLLHVDTGATCPTFSDDDHVNFVTSAEKVGSEDRILLSFLQYPGQDGSFDQTGVTGIARIDEIDEVAGRVRGGVAGRLDDDNVISGTFDVPLCTE